MKNRFLYLAVLIIIVLGIIPITLVSTGVMTYKYPAKETVNKPVDRTIDYKILISELLNERIDRGTVCYNMPGNQVDSLRNVVYEFAISLPSYDEFVVYEGELDSLMFSISCETSTF